MRRISRSLLNKDLVFSELHEPAEIRDALINLGSSLFDQTVNTPERLTSLAEKYSSKAHAVTLSCDRQLVGLSAFYDNEAVAFISMLVIRHEKQNQGYGTALLKEVLQKCKKNTSVQLAVSSANSKAIKFYQKVGFKTKQRDQDKIILEISENGGKQ